MRRSHPMPRLYELTAKRLQQGGDRTIAGMSVLGRKQTFALAREREVRRYRLARVPARPLRARSSMPAQARRTAPWRMPINSGASSFDGRPALLGPAVPDAPTPRLTCTRDARKVNLLRRWVCRPAHFRARGRRCAVGAHRWAAPLRSRQGSPLLPLREPGMLSSWMPRSFTTANTISYFFA